MQEAYFSNTNSVIITIGDELLNGQVIDTNSAFLAKELNKIGILVSKRVAVGDNYKAIWQALDDAGKEAKIVILTGGLGPTADDITKPLLCKYFNGSMVLDKPTLNHIEYLFEKVFNKTGPLLERNIKQAEVPDVCTILKNEVGTAPGMLFEKEGTLFFALPGVPHEMKWITENHIIPKVLKEFGGGIILHETLVTIGAGESVIAEMLKDFEDSLPNHISLAYLPNYGIVRLRLSSKGNDKEQLQSELATYFNQLQTILNKILVTTKDETMAQVVANMLLKNHKTVSTAESCTGGYIAHLLSQIPGASAYYEGSIISYSYAIKKTILKVDELTLSEKGAVSKETVEIMALNARANLKTDYAIAVSGIMGPSGGTIDKPVGTVWLAVCDGTMTVTKKLNLKFDREKNIQLTAIAALNLLRELIVDNP